MKECYETNVGLRLGEEKGGTNNLKVTNPTPLFSGPYRRYGVIFCIMQMFHKQLSPNPANISVHFNSLVAQASFS